ncbi:MAG: cysteine desulfurase, partial [Chloroflexi bacterium]|nr:cysteine desulfurase [Chloroflexota bacterium]
AMRGVALANRSRGKHIITSAVEHKAVLNTAHQLEHDFGFDVTYLSVGQYGMVDPSDVQAAITPQTVLISIIYAQNEVGTIQPLAEISRIAHEHGIPFHTDAVQAPGHLPLDVQELGMNLVSLSAHKFFGPKGVGLLYVRQGIEFLPMQTGGSQEENRRAGTENVPGIVGMAKALEIATKNREEDTQRIIPLRDRLISGVLENIEGAYLTGHPQERLPNNASFVFSGITGEGLLLGLDLEGIAASSGSACTSGSLEPSPVLLAMGLEPELAVGSLRLTLGPENTEEEVEQVLSVLPEMVEKLRGARVAYSPLSAEKAK